MNFFFEGDNIVNSFFGTLKENWKLILWIVVFVFLIFIFIFIIWNLYLNEPGVESKCVDINGMKSFSFDSCYNFNTNIIYLITKRSSFGEYDVKGIEVSFFDVEERSYDLIDIPAEKSIEIYQFSALKNPRNIYVSLGVEKNFEGFECGVPRRLFVRDCDGVSQEGVVSEDYSGGKDLGDRPQDQDLRDHLVELAMKEQAWKTKCESTWECSSWESCSGGIQRRSCEDLNNCFIPTNVPDTAEICGDICLENWKCEWSECVNGFTIPTCVDSNNCGTSFNLPKKISCDFNRTCVPEIECSDWSDCSVDYGLLDIEKTEATELKGFKSRVCIDRKSCVGAIKEEAICSTGVDIYTRKFTKCNKNYVDVFNKLDESIIARIDKGTDTNPQLNIRVGTIDNNLYCDSCYNGALDGDEAKIDCGGSCASCERSGPISLFSETFFGKIGKWMGNLF
ncbi:MAG: hypothetical protein NUV97_03340 [archaeon]|nr:hypothetical protein [archaeon]MCR4323923.1 hypothetical protein [Nanoarchaeota archaeon]